MVHVAPLSLAPPLQCLGSVLLRALLLLAGWPAGLALLIISALVPESESLWTEPALSNI